MDNIEKRILQIIDDNADKILAVAKDIFAHPEQGYHEFRTAQVVADFLKECGVETRKEIAITGVKGSVGNGKGPNIALIGELDALLNPAHPNSVGGYAHACGHNAQITCMLGAALALTDPEVAEKLDGTATFFAVPAEEYQDAAVAEKVRRENDIRCLGGKCELIRRGEFDDVDMAITTHTFMVERDCGADLMIGNSACTGFVGKTVYIHGVPSHAAAAPHAGVNALNAASLGLSALGMIRETFQEKDCVRVHPFIRKGGDAINVVPSEVIVDMMVRANNFEAIEKISKKVDACFRGAAMAIGCTVDIVDSQGYMPCPQIDETEMMMDAASLLGDIKAITIPKGLCNTASTDVGDLCAIMPVANFTFGGSVGALHTVDYKVTDDYVAYILPAKYMALLTYRFLKDGAKEAKEYIAGYTPTMTRDEYKAYCERMDNGK